MTGQQLWQEFLRAGIPGGELRGLGYDLFWVREAPTEGAGAVAKISKMVGLSPAQTYAAFNSDPGRAVLQGLANDYRRKAPWDATSEGTRQYLTLVAERIGAIAAAPLTMTPAAAAAAAFTPAPGPSVLRVFVSTAGQPDPYPGRSALIGLSALITAFSLAHAFASSDLDAAKILLKKENAR